MYFGDLFELRTFWMAFTSHTQILTHTSPGHCPDADRCEETASDDHPTPAALRWGHDPRCPSVSFKLLLFGDGHRSSQSQGRPTSVSLPSDTKDAGAHSSTPQCCPFFSECTARCHWLSLFYQNCSQILKDF